MIQKSDENELRSRALELVRRDIQLWNQSEPDGKDACRQALLRRKHESLEQARSWIIRYEDKLLPYFANGSEVDPSSITPEIEFCSTQQQHDLFRYARLHWSMPYSDYVGRRYRMLVRDASLPKRPIIGIAALGSALWALKPRDDAIGWDQATREDRLPFVMDAFVLGAVPPYNFLLGGKLVALLVTSNEVREYHRRRYQDRPTLIRGRTVNDLVLVVTTSLFGKNASIYNRLGYGGELLYRYCGETSGEGTIHVTDETIDALRQFLSSIGVQVGNRFGDGPNWRIRLLRTGLVKLGLDADGILRHGQRRGVYVIAMASNSLDFLQGKTSAIQYCDRPKEELVAYWKERWLKGRIRLPRAMDQFLKHTRESMRLLKD